MLTNMIGIIANLNKANRRRPLTRIAILPMVLASIMLVACVGDSSASSPATILRLGYFANITHAPAILGIEDGFFQDALGKDVKLEVVTFSSGPLAIEALYSGSIDATFIGPNPAINGYARSKGQALRIIAGTTSGGAALVVRNGINSTADLKGKTLASPSLGNTQDVALRSWLQAQGYTTDTNAGGEVSVRPQENADTLTTFIDGSIDGAWVPEPWSTRLVLEGKGHVLVDERDLWPNQQFVTTHLIVDADYLKVNPTIVTNLLTGLLNTLDYMAANSEDAKTKTNAAIKAITTKELGTETINDAWTKLMFTYDPIASSLIRSKDNAIAVGLLDDVDLSGIYDLGLLNELLKSRNLPEVSNK